MKSNSSIGITGRVEIFNKETGEQLWGDSNMITNGGRQVFAMLASANWDSSEIYNNVKEFSPRFIHIGSSSWEGSDFNADIQTLKEPKDTFIPYTNVFRGFDLTQESQRTVQLGGNSVTYQFDYVNLSKDALDIKELGLYSKNRNLLAYEPIRGTKISAELEMTLVIKWIISFK